MSAARISLHACLCCLIGLPVLQPGAAQMVLRSVPPPLDSPLVVIDTVNVDGLTLWTVFDKKLSWRGCRFGETHFMVVDSANAAAVDANDSVSARALWFLDPMSFAGLMESNGASYQEGYWPAGEAWRGHVTSTERHRTRAWKIIQHRLGSFSCVRYGMSFHKLRNTMGMEALWFKRRANDQVVVITPLVMP